MKKLNLIKASITKRLLTASPTGVKSIETDTPIRPVLVADKVVSDWLNAVKTLYPNEVDLASKKEYEIADYLEANANRIYVANATFRKQIQAPGNKGRDTLRAFMFHWMTAQMLKSFKTIKLAKVPRSVTGFAP